MEKCRFSTNKVLAHWRGINGGPYSSVRRTYRRRGFGLDLNDPLGPDTVSELTDAFLDRHVLCIRDQDISMSRFLEIATVFGTPQVQKVKYYAHPDTNLISVVSPEVNRDREGSNGKPLVRGTTFHTDHSYWPKP